MLDPQNASPLYVQLKSLLKQEMENNIYPPGSRMPSEPDLAVKYGVSRVTVRRSIRELAEEGYLESKQGKGNFVIHRKVKQELSEVGGFTDAMQRSKRGVDRAILEKALIPADPSVAEYLHIPAGDTVIKLKRIMYEAGLPMFLDTAYYSAEKFPGFIGKIFENVSTYALLRKEYGVTFAKVYREFKAVAAPADVCEYLQCAPGDPLFDLFKISYDENGEVITIAKSLVLASRSTYILMCDETGAQHLHFKRSQNDETEAPGEIRLP